jgi:hypothetical protein
MNNLQDMDEYTAAILDNFDPEEVFTYDPEGFDNARGRRQAQRLAAKTTRQAARKQSQTERQAARKAGQTERSLARSQTRKESRLARIAAKGGAPAELMQVDKTSIPTASAKINQVAMEQQVEPAAISGAIVESPKAQERLTNYVIKQGETPMVDPYELAAQAAAMRQMQITQAMNEPPFNTEEPADMEYNLLEEEYENEYLPEVNETGDLEGFSNFVDPATWAAAKKIGEVGTAKAREARFKQGKKFFGETEAQFKARKAKPAGALEEAAAAGVDEYRRVYTQDFVSQNMITIILLVGALVYAGYYFGKK